MNEGPEANTDTASVCRRSKHRSYETECLGRGLTPPHSAHNGIHLLDTGQTVGHNRAQWNLWALGTQTRGRVGTEYQQGKEEKGNYFSLRA